MIMTDHRSGEVHNTPTSGSCAEGVSLVVHDRSNACTDLGTGIIFTEAYGHIKDED